MQQHLRDDPQAQWRGASEISPHPYLHPRSLLISLPYQSMSQPILPSCTQPLLSHASVIPLTPCLFRFLQLLALGVLPEERNKSLDLLENAVRALHLETVDDMHLATRFASLLKIHIQDLRRSPASFATDTNPPDPHSAPTNPASTHPPTNYYNSASAVSSNTMVGSVTNNVADRELGSAFVDDNLGYLAELDAPMQLGQFEGSTGLSLRNPLFFNMDETWNVFGNMLA